MAMRNPLAARRRFWYGTVLLVLLIVASAFVWRNASPARARFVEYAMLNGDDMPAAIATGGDGSVWFTLDFTDAIGVIRDGKLERLKKPKPSLDPAGIAVAEDGAAWYTDSAAKQVSRISPSGQIISIDVGTPVAKLGRAAAAPDGSIWFSEATSYSITRLKDGKLDRHIIESVRGAPFGVAVSQDGTVWATLQNANQVLSIGPGRTMKTFDVPTRGSGPSDIAVDQNGDVWFIEFRGNKLGRLHGEQFEEHSIAEDNVGLSGLALTPDGSVWFGMVRNGSLGRFKDGEITSYKLPREHARPFGLASDRHGNIWYTDITGYVGMLAASELR